MAASSRQLVLQQHDPRIVVPGCVQQYQPQLIQPQSIPMHVHHIARPAHVHTNQQHSQVGNTRVVGYNQTAIPPVRYHQDVSHFSPSSSSSPATQNAIPLARDGTDGRVVLHVYDVTTHEFVGQANNRLRTFSTGAYHAGVEVYGKEWSFGGGAEAGCTGVSFCTPTSHESHVYREAVIMGSTMLSRGEVFQLIARLEKEWLSSDYDILRHNCTHFADALCLALGVGAIPKWVTKLATAPRHIKQACTNATSAGITTTVATRAVAKLADDAAVKAVENFAGRALVGPAASVVKGPAGWLAAGGEIVGGLACKEVASVLGADEVTQAHAQSKGGFAAAVGAGVAYGAACGGPVGAAVGAAVGGGTSAVGKVIEYGIDTVRSHWQEVSAPVDLNLKLGKKKTFQKGDRLFEFGVTSIRLRRTWAADFLRDFCIELYSFKKFNIFFYGKDDTLIGRIRCQIPGYHEKNFNADIPTISYVVLQSLE